MSAPSPGLVSRAASLVIAVLAGAVLIWMLNSSLFDIRSVSVHRASASPPPALDPRKIDGIAQSALGQNAFRVDTAALRERLRAIPGVADTVLTTSLDGRVTVTVSYEAPVANWVIGGQSYLVNSDGEVLAPRYMSDLELTVEDEGSAAARPGDRIDLDALHAAYQLQHNLPLLRVMPSRIRYAPGRLVVVDHSGRELQFGTPERLASKLVALHAVLEHAGRRGERIASIDLRPVDRPTYRTVEAPPVISTLDAGVSLGESNEGERVDDGT